jgi:hypothetical protein
MNRRSFLTVTLAGALTVAGVVAPSGEAQAQKKKKKKRKPRSRARRRKMHHRRHAVLRRFHRW